MDKIEAEVRERLKDVPEGYHSSKIGEMTFHHGSKESRIKWEVGLARCAEKIRQREVEFLTGNKPMTEGLV
jgi:hypothetical protein